MKSRSPFMQASTDEHQRLILADARFAPGNVWFVNSEHANAGDSAGKGQTPEAPFDTIDYAIGQCTANQGDLIVVMPGHIETISAAGGLACDVAGVTILGLGYGTNRPKLLFTGTAATVAVSAANVRLSNIYCSSGIDEVVKMFNITGAWCELDRIDHVEDASYQTIQFLLTGTGGDFLYMHDCFHYQNTAAAADQVWIMLNGADGARIVNNYFHLKLRNTSGSMTISGVTTESLGIFIDSNKINQVGGTTQDDIISLLTSTTGLVSNNRIGGDVGTLAASVDLASCYGSENYIATTANKSGILDPVVA